MSYESEWSDDDTRHAQEYMESFMAGEGYFYFPEEVQAQAFESMQDFHYLGLDISKAVTEGSEPKAVWGDLSQHPEVETIRKAGELCRELSKDIFARIPGSRLPQLGHDWMQRQEAKRVLNDPDLYAEKLRLSSPRRTVEFRSKVRYLAGLAGVKLTETEISRMVPRPGVDEPDRLAELVDAAFQQ